MSATAKAKARREAILGARGDRLKKLTSSARGDDSGGVYDDPPVPSLGSNLKNFVGEESTLPPPPQSLPSPRASPGPQTQIPQNGEMPIPDWASPEQQQLLRTLLSGMSPSAGGGPSLTAGSSLGPDPNNPQAPEDPFAALAAAFAGGKEGGMFAPQPAAQPKPKTLLQRIIPILHILSMAGLLLFFVFWQEPEKYLFYRTHRPPDITGDMKTMNMWQRWASLASTRPDERRMTLFPLPEFFWAFTTIELILHSLRLFVGSSDFQPPMLLALVLPSLPPPLPTAITTSLRYFQMAGLILDDIAMLVFSLGVIIFVSYWTT